MTAPCDHRHDRTRVERFVDALLAVPCPRCKAEARERRLLTLRRQFIGTMTPLRNDIVEALNSVGTEYWNPHFTAARITNAIEDYVLAVVVELAEEAEDKAR